MRLTFGAAAVAVVLFGAFSGVLSLQACKPSSLQASSAPVPTFTKDVAPILYANCTSCHRTGEIAPMSLMTYKEARPWARSIATQVGKGAMPP